VPAEEVFMRSTTLVVSILPLLFPAALRAQSAPPKLHSGSAGGLHVGTPAALSVALGAYRQLSDTPGEGRTQALFALVEPGVKAGRVSAGYGNSYGTLGTAWMIRATALRVWHGTIGSYVGAEASIVALGLGPRLGIFRQVGAGSGSSVRVTADFAFGL
jgi:hypothetical protein